MPNHIQKVAIVGATGTVGSFIVAELLKQGKHTVTALTRSDSQATMPQGVEIAKVDYNNKSTLVDALKGQDALIITMNRHAPEQVTSDLIEAAAEANVPYVLPNEWCPDMAHEPMGSDALMGPMLVKRVRKIEEIGKSSWIGMITGFWYEFSLGVGPCAYGMDWANRTFTFYDDGETKINTITFPQTGRAVAGVLSLPIEPEKPGAPCLSNYRNKYVYTSSFLVSQKDMFASVLRVTGTKESDWTIRHEKSADRHADGKKALFSGDETPNGFQKLLYSRVFYKDGSGNHEARHGLDNEVLGLPKEDLDEFTRKAVDMAKEGYTYA
ncbi:CipA protein [Xylariomycetidae sp. FL0641]|nr:CipA protein [Xylariomycetidae sp. FL0641]